MELLRKNALRLCPSAQPEMEGAEVFAVIQGTAEEPRAAYLNQTVPLTPEISACAAPISPAEIFRISAPCATRDCCHFGEGRCNLVTRLVQLAPEVVDNPPPCAQRPRCMWWLQEGLQACLRCPQVVTRMYGPSQPMIEAASVPDSIRRPIR